MAQILTFLKDASFDADATHVMGEAFEQACQLMERGGDATDLGSHSITRCILANAQQGERDPARLCAAALAAVLGNNARPARGISRPS